VAAWSTSPRGPPDLHHYLGLYSCRLIHHEGKVKFRLKIVHTFQECDGFRKTARTLTISSNTVRK